MGMHKGKLIPFRQKGEVVVNSQGVPVKVRTQGCDEAEDPEILAQLDEAHEELSKILLLP